VTATSLRGAVFGRTGSGKTEWLARRWLVQCPRLLIFDETCEWRRRAPNAVFVDGPAATLDALRAVADHPRWQIITDCEPPEETETVVAALMPRGKYDRSYPALVGGMAMLIDEADQVIGMHPSRVLRAPFRRGRHAHLSTFVASQRPNLSKEMTSQCDFIAVLAIHEPNDLEYFGDLMGKEEAAKALEWVNQDDHPHRVAVFQTQGRQLTLLEPIRLGP